MATQGWADAMRSCPEHLTEVSRLLSEPPAEASAGRGSSSPSTATRPLGDPGCSPAAAARHTPPPPDDAAVSRLRSLSQQERGRRLIEAAKQGAVEQLRELLAAGADVGAREEKWGTSCTALHLAAGRGHVAAASCLVGAGAEVDARSSVFQRTPLHWAAFNGHADFRFQCDAAAKGTVQNTAAVAAESGKAFPAHAPAADSPRGVTVSGWGEGSRASRGAATETRARQPPVLGCEADLQLPLSQHRPPGPTCGAAGGHVCNRYTARQTT
ncbi:putative ankyrin-containing lipoprotein Lxx09580 [Schistocerca piceifrons]|uniref:putative ankyrin-containing lipoprotein Lxx09580 n=1 Tax=Schistocerca piceifrons TaxID=274613 RepID=UPI001F5EE5BA|nr:putative ankyrin-containing lipoprotein Lxx09580 [Schistocerca piceifrons]